MASIQWHIIDIIGALMSNLRVVVLSGHILFTKDNKRLAEQPRKHPRLISLDLLSKS